MNGTYASGTITISSKLTASGHIGWSVRGQQFNGTTGPYVASGTVELDNGSQTTRTISGWPLWQVFLAPVGEPPNMMAAEGLSIGEEGNVAVTIVQTQEP